MIKSIKHFGEVSTGVFEKLVGDFMRNPTDFASFTEGITEELHRIGQILIQETLEEMNQMICDSGKRKQHWVVERHEKKHLLTVHGDVYFKKTYFTSKETGISECLLDRILNLDRNERIAEDAEARLLKEAVQTSYRRGGEDACLTTEKVTKQAVMRKIHSLEFPKDYTEPAEKKIVDYLYIEADEDHISLQYRDKKGDLIRCKNGRKNNNAIAKLIYVHEGIEPESPGDKHRHRLIHPHYFSRTAEGCSNEELWDEVYHYIDSHYDLSKVKKIYFSSDGGAWIVSGMRRIGGVIHVLDNWTAAKLRLTKVRGRVGSSTEGHVPVAAGAEYMEILSSRDIMNSEKNRHGKVGKYLDAMTHTMRKNPKSQHNFLKWIWEL